MDKESVGWWGERIVAAQLQRAGFVLLDHRYRKTWGELDLVMSKSNTLHFVEVKTTLGDLAAKRSSEAFRPEFQVTKQKLRSIRRTVETWLREYRLDHAVQIDVASVYLYPSERHALIDFFWQVG